MHGEVVPGRGEVLVEAGVGDRPDHAQLVQQLGPPRLQRRRTQRAALLADPRPSAYVPPSTPSPWPAFAKRRCLLPADGFYEWQNIAATKTAKARKQPYFISPEDGQLMALAGLYEFWRDPTVNDDSMPGAWWSTCTIITTEATDAAGHVHPRMPLAIAPADWSTWLDPTHQNPDELRALLTTPAAGHLAARAVSTAVNNVRNNGPYVLAERAEGTGNV